MESKGYIEGAPEVCVNFQVDLSCLVDGELDDGAAGRAVMHMEACDGCRGFFEDTRTQIKLHRDMTDPSRLFARIAMLTGGHSHAGASAAESIDLVHRLATIFYQLGKAYVLASIDPGYRERVFEATVPLDGVSAEEFAYRLRLREGSGLHHYRFQELAQTFSVWAST